MLRSVTAAARSWKSCARRWRLMDTWTAPEPSPYFMTRLGARMREEREAPRQSWLQRIRARFVYGPQMHARPLAAMALTVMLLVGGGAYLGVTNVEQPQPQPDRRRCGGARFADARQQCAGAGSAGGDLG